MKTALYITDIAFQQIFTNFQ